MQDVEENVNHILANIGHRPVTTIFWSKGLGKEALFPYPSLCVLIFVQRTDHTDDVDHSQKNTIFRLKEKDYF